MSEVGKAGWSDLDEVKFRPLDALIRDLEDRGAPLMQWTVWWGEGGDDPLARAWASTGQQHARVKILLWPRKIAGGTYVTIRCSKSDHVIVLTWDEIASGETHSREFTAARTVFLGDPIAVALAAVDPPTLDELLARCER